MQREVDYQQIVGDLATALILGGDKSHLMDVAGIAFDATVARLAVETNPRRMLTLKLREEECAKILELRK